MKLGSSIIFLFTAWCHSLAKSNSEECQVQYTYGYNYVDYYHVDDFKNVDGNCNSNATSGTFCFELYVKAVSDAHILLADSKNLNDMSAYEIVIGGGKNSFSQIRLYHKQMKATQPTPNIVSPVEYRGFWIKMKPVGLIMVGKKGETEPFLVWINSKPFPIKYIAFSTWKNVKGEWYFDCKENYDPELVEEEKVMSIQRLKTALLTSYNPANLPEKDGNPKQIIEINLEANYFYMDEKYGELTLSGIAFLKWTDWKLIWNSSEYEGIDYLYLMPYQVWTPYVRILNSVGFDKKSLFTFTGGVAVKNTGEVRWKVLFHSITSCVLGYRNWPLDVHNCSLVFGFMTEPLEIDIKDMDLSKLSKSEWKILKIDGKEWSISPQINDFESTLDIHFQRMDPTYEFLLMPPFLGAAVVSFISFWLYPNSAAKLFLNCGSLVILTLILMSLGERVPRAAASTPKIVHLYSWSVLVVCIPIVMFVVMKYVPAYVTLPRILSVLINSNFMEVMLFLPKNSELQKQSNYSNLREKDDRPVSAVRLATFIERLVFLFYFTSLLVPFLMFLFKFEKFLNL